MIEAYSVSTTLTIHDLVSPAMLKITRGLKEMDLVVGGINKNLKALGLESASIKSVDSATTALSRHMALANNHTEALKKNLVAIKALGLSGASTPVPIAVGAGYGGRNGGGGGGVHGPRLHAGPGGIGMGAVSMGLGGAAIPLAIGATGIYGGMKAFEAARDYELALARFKTLNLGKDVNDKADRFARTTHAFGTSRADLMETLRESVGMFGNLDTAIAAAPKLAELNAANSLLFGGKIGALDKGSIQSLMRFNDMRGLTDSMPDFMRGLDLAQKMVTGSGGATKFSDLEQLAKRGGAAFKGLSDDGVMMLSTLLQEQGGAATGTAVMSLYQNLVSGRTPIKTMAALEKAKLGKVKEIYTGSVGGKPVKSTVLTNIVDEKLLRESPGHWLMKYGIAAAKDSGAKNDSETIAFMNSMISNRVGSNMAANFTTQHLQAMRDFNMVRNAMGVEKTVDTAKETGGGAQQNFLAAWKDFKQTFGEMVLPQTTELLKTGTSLLHDITDFYSKNAEFFKTVGMIERYINPVAVGNRIFEEARSWTWGAKPGANPPPFGSTGPRSFSDATTIATRTAPLHDGTGNVYLDSHLVGRVMGPAFGREASRSILGGGGSFDGSMSLPPVNLATR